MGLKVTIATINFWKRSKSAASTLIALSAATIKFRQWIGNEFATESEYLWCKPAELAATAESIRSVAAARLSNVVVIGNFWRLTEKRMNEPQMS